MAMGYFKNTTNIVMAVLAFVFWLFDEYAVTTSLWFLLFMRAPFIWWPLHFFIPDYDRNKNNRD
jgi:hypothetical protein